MNVNKITLRDWVTGAVIAVLALVPLVVSLTDNAFILDLATRLVILAIAAISLNLSFPGTTHKTATATLPF